MRVKINTSQELTYKLYNLVSTNNNSHLLKMIFDDTILSFSDIKDRVDTLVQFYLKNEENIEYKDKPKNYI